ncbi:ligase-associated DNA damage response exonuclease [Rhodopirellula halodulae]|uniref:ligase-associated DNA damage response exonuclease n=1 Tax=Rhodopirellula halodulae TaxID=2894198 RepID=UPI001E44C703|nr:ligase-associated DNA damage response exonuclease [Rhodopirellula sp. JC737]MCC9655519.1 ligase-associated DNA damage response exonuclease [Rhodopirellula sp. JC737]
MNRPRPKLLETTPAGLHCPIGGFYIDPVRPVDRAVITHGHSDHARWGSRHYLSASPGEPILRMRLSEEAEFEFLDYGQKTTVGGVQVSLHPAGHMLGSAQVRLEYRGEVAVVTGDYKLQSDATCDDFEPIRCHTFVTESTFGLPIYQWREDSDIFADINQWWRTAAAEGKCCLLYGYAVGKSQRLLSGLDPSIGPIYTHGAVEKGVQAYRESGVKLPETTSVTRRIETEAANASKSTSGEVTKRRQSSRAAKLDWSGSMVVAVPSAHGTPWMRKFGTVSTAMASGWMAIRGARRRRAVDRGFVLSDHVDWPGLMNAIVWSEADEIWVTHGSTAVVSRYLNEGGLQQRLQQHRSNSEWQHRRETLSAREIPSYWESTPGDDDSSENELPGKESSDESGDGGNPTSG